MNIKDKINRLKEIPKYGDIEAAHGDADDILCEVLNELGFSELVDEYEKVIKWYA